MSMLNRLFDYQRFEGNQELQQVIDSVHSRYSARELSLDDMDSMRTVAHALSTELRLQILKLVVDQAKSVGEIARLSGEMGFDDCEIVQLSIARSRRVGRYNLMNGLNPIWIAAMQSGREENEN